MNQSNVYLQKFIDDLIEWYGKEAVENATQYLKDHNQNWEDYYEYEDQIMTENVNRILGIIP